ncbi:MAG: 50S ribosomal protein L11 methyltransferase [Lachnospiraceae bacterium]|nr:50S ribosomal protein L11 methyltransferase [Lachnospiraceae bacterium]
MKWLRFRVKTITAAEDILVSDLYDKGLEGAQIEDRVPLTALEKEQMFVDIAPDPGTDDGIAYLSFFVEAPEDEEEKKKAADDTRRLIEETIEEWRSFNTDVGEGSIEVSETEDIDWINNWKKYFHQFTIDDLLVIPSWEEPEEKDADKMILRIDPGTAFGTGMHETTQLCIRQLKKYIDKETRLLDVGTGSGILGILSLMYGIKSVTATDLDPCAVPAVADNLERNHVDPAGFELLIGNIIDDKEIKDRVGYECYDVAVANILTEVLLPLTPVLHEHLKKNGIYITSGIIEGKETQVEEAMKDNGFEVLGTYAQGEWRSVVGRKL